jgi:CBS domain-containing protein
MLVEEVMTRWPVVVGPGTTAREALRLLDEHTITALPVVDAQERVVGVVSDADLVRDAVAVVDGERRAVGVLSRGDVVHLVARSDERTERDLAALFALLGVGWTAVVHGGAARVAGPVDERARSLARRAVSTVPAVTSVDIVDAG